MIRYVFHRCAMAVMVACSVHTKEGDESPNEILEQSGRWV